jgi:hypothetical protein
MGISWKAIHLPAASGDLLSASAPVEILPGHPTTLQLLLSRCAGVKPLLRKGNLMQNSNLRLRRTRLIATRQQDTVEVTSPLHPDYRPFIDTVKHIHNRK